MSAGPYPDVDEVLSLLLPGMRGALGERLLGAYLFGSVASGDYDAGVSDIDVLAVLTSEATTDELAGLARVHSSVARSLPHWRDRVEVLYSSAEALRTFRERSSPIAVISPGEPLNVKPAGIEWLMNWWDVRENGIVLFGPAASEFIGPISSEEFVASIRQYAEEFPGRIEESDRQKWHAYITLTMCRSLYTCTQRKAVSKQTAAEWAIDQMPEWETHIRQALATRLSFRDDAVATPSSREETARFVRLALERICAAG